MPRGPEGKIQDKATAHARSRGCFACKFESVTHSGVPDYLFSHLKCGVFLIEFKAPGKKPSPHQVLRMQEMVAAGVTIFWTDSSRIAMEIIDDMIDHGMPVRHANVELK